MKFIVNLQSMEDMEDYLESTKFCDCDNQEIIDKAKELTKNDKTPKEMALSIFYFVRDQITFMMSETDKASKTLKKGHGHCSTKTNLQVALLRTVNIPARYHLASLTKECLKGVVSESLYKLFPDEISHHQWCECYLPDRWIACDTLFDEALAKGFYKKVIFTKEDIPTIDWDGEHDLNTMTKWIIEDKGTLLSLDNLFIEAQRESDELPIEKDQLEMIVNQSNKYTDSIRKL